MLARRDGGLHVVPEARGGSGEALAAQRGADAREAVETVATGDAGGGVNPEALGLVGREEVIAERRKCFITDALRATRLQLCAHLRPPSAPWSPS